MQPVFLSDEGSFFGNIIFWLFFAVTLLFIAVYLQYRIIRRLKRELFEAQERASGIPISPPAQPASRPAPSQPASVTQSQLPDPGLLYKYQIGEEGQEKYITIGQSEGNIKLFSTETVNDHLSLYIRALENDRDRDIYNLPGEMKQEYMIDLRRNGKVLHVFPGEKKFSQMGSRQKLYIKEEADEFGDPTFPTIEPQNPVRFRLGDRLDQEDRFRNGYFEFHLFTRDLPVETKGGVKKIEKVFFLRLYKIYPGYDTAGADEDGIYPMIDPFAKK